MNKTIKNLTLTALFLAVGMILPFFTGQIPAIGSMLLPMHIPVILCGLICGWKYGLVCGFVLPIFRSLLFSMPPIMPQAAAMAFELAVYGFTAGWLYSHSKWQCVKAQCVKALYRCLILAMIAGRLVWGLVMWILMSAFGQTFTLQAFAAGALTTAIPGILLQLILIPALMLALHKTGMVPFKKATSLQHA